jgi:hypothetical protein
VRRGQRAVDARRSVIGGACSTSEQSGEGSHAKATAHGAKHVATRAWSLAKAATVMRRSVIHRR